MRKEVFLAVQTNWKPKFYKFCHLFCGCFLIDSSEPWLSNLETTKSVSTLRIFSSSDIMKTAGGLCGHYEQMRHISPSLGTQTPRTIFIGRKKILMVWHQYLYTTDKYMCGVLTSSKMSHLVVCKRIPSSVISIKQFKVLCNSTNAAVKCH